MTKKKIIIISGIVLAICLTILGFALSIKNPTCQIVDDFLATVIEEENYIDAYNYLDVPQDIIKSEIALKTTLNELGLNTNEIQSYKTSVGNKKENKVLISIIDKNNVKHKVELSVNNGKIIVPYKTDYEIKVPAGTKVILNEITLNKELSTKVETNKIIPFKIEQNSKEEISSEASIPIFFDEYKKLTLLDTTYNIKLTNNQGLNSEDTIELNANYAIDELKATEYTSKIFGEATKIFIGTVIDVAVNQKEFDDINNLISKKSTNLERIKTAYSDLKSVFNRVDDNGVKITYSDYKLVDIVMNDVYMVDENKVAGLIQYNLEYKENKTIDTATLSEDKQAQRVGIATFEICEDGTLLLDNSQGIFSLHQ